MEEYLQTVLEQIRCKKAHELIRQEMEVHLEEQICDYMAEGMTREEATEAAVKDMGDPVETGVELDRIHRPKIEWQIVILVGIIVTFGLVLQYFLLKNVATIEGFGMDDFRVVNIQNSMCYTVFGFLVMILIYRLDYTWVGRYAKWLMGCLGIVMLVLSYVCWVVTDNVSSYLMLTHGFGIPAGFILFLMIPIYAGILYQYRGGGYRELLYSCLWMGIPYFCGKSCNSLTLSMAVIVMMGVLLTIAVCKGWFCVNKKGVCLAFWSLVIVMPIVMFFVGAKFSPYWSYKLEQLYHYIRNDPEWNYMQTSAAGILLHSRLLGSSGVDAVHVLDSPLNMYILPSIAAEFGILPMLLVIGLLCCFVGKIFQIAHKQKNQLGMMMGYACGVVFFIHMLISVVYGLGLIPLTCGVLPFFAINRENTILCFILTGWILSIYRYKNIVTEHAGKAARYKLLIEKVK